MSSLAAWSYTSTATVWPLLSRGDWNGVKTFGPPESFACDYSATSMRMTDANGVEFTTREILHTERSTVKAGDMVLIGKSTTSSPVAAGAFEVRAITRYADTFENRADDFKIAT